MQPIDDRREQLEARVPGWVEQTLDEALDRAVVEFGDRPYVVTDDASFTYAEIQDWSVRIANGLRCAGFGPGDHIAIVLANYVEFVAVKYAVARIGATAVPINFLNRSRELGFVLRQSNAAALITMDRFRDLDYLSFLDELAPGWEANGGGDHLPDLRRVFVFATGEGDSRDEDGRDGLTTLETLGETAEGWEPTAGRDPRSNADILYTSGTTGNPKGVLLTHDMLLRTAYGSAYGRAFEDGRRVLFSLPMYHVFGYVEGMLAVLFVGGTIIPQLTFDPTETLAGIERHRASDVLMVPTMTLAVLDVAREASFDLTSLTSVISSGGQSPESIWQEIFDLLGPDELTAGYGMSETTASTTVTRPDDPIEMLATTNGRLRDVGVAGDPNHGGRLAVYRVVDPVSGAELPNGEIGEFRVRGLGVTSGYYDNPEETAAAIDDDGWLRTGDLGMILDDDYLRLVGRTKECYRCGGEQVVPKEIEDVLTTHESVSQAHVVPLQDDRMGEVGVAYIVFKKGRSAEPADLIDFCADRMARFKVPKHVVPIAESDLPVTPSGRPRKFLLAEQAAAALLPPATQPEA